MLKDRDDIVVINQSHEDQQSTREVEDQKVKRRNK
jgi:hypothetical protein